MAKKRVQKHRIKRRKAQTSYSLVTIVIILALLLIAGLIIKSFMVAESYKVLGASTFIAKGGDDSGGEGHGGGGSDSGGGSGGSNSGSSGSGGGATSESNSSGGGLGSGGSTGSSNGEESVSDKVKVRCTGPDGKQFETEFKDCKELNNAWNKPVVFTVIARQTQKRETKTESRTRSAEPTLSVSPEGEKEDVNETDKRTKTETKSNEERISVQLSETERIRTRTKDGKTRVDITSGGIKTRLEIRDGRIVVKAEQEDGTEVELEDDTLLKIDDRLADDDIKIATAGAGEFILRKGTTGAVTSFPLSIDLATNTLYVNTPSGQRAVTVLPQQAVTNLIAANVVSRLGGNAVIGAVNQKSLTSINDLIALGEQNGIPVYEIKGISDQKLLGFIPVTIEKDVTVSAETGNALFIKESLSDRILDAISI